LLKEEEVPLGALVNIFCSLNKEIIRVNGEPITFISSLVDFSTRSELQPIPYKSNNCKSEILNLPRREGWIDDLIFTPVEVYNQKDAPVGGNYAVFQDGVRIIIKLESGNELPYEVLKADEQEFIFSKLFPFTTASHSHVFHTQVYDFREYSDKQLIDYIIYIRENTRFISELGLKDILKHTEYNIIRLVEELSSRYRDSPMDLVRVHRENPVLGSRYLRVVELPSDSKLVRVDRGHDN